MKLRRSFTLVELIVVIAIIALAVGMASVTMRRDASAVKFEQAVREFQSFVARTRAQAMELGADRSIIYLPAEREFVSSETPAEVVDEEVPTTPFDVPEEFRIVDEAEEVEIRPTSGRMELSWKLPDDYEFAAISFDTTADYEETLEIFRFFPDGSGSGRRQFTMQYKNLKKIMEISPLTGLLKITEEEVQ